MRLAVMLGKFVKQIVREWCPSTVGPLLPSMTDSLLAPGREVLYKRYHTGELVQPTILGPSTEGDDFVRMKYTRNVRDYENPLGPLSAVQFPLRSPSPMSSRPSEETPQPLSRGRTTSLPSHLLCGDSDDSSGVDDSNSDIDGHCGVIWAKAGCGVWGLCHVFENPLCPTRDLIEDSAVPSNLLSQRCLSRFGLPLLPVPRRARAPSLGSMFNSST